MVWIIFNLALLGSFPCHGLKSSWRDRTNKGNSSVKLVTSIFEKNFRSLRCSAFTQSKEKKGKGEKAL
ncbi:hypothetical protein WA1_02230 [Scytonema hofmannii PCC 7110]|uniref:Uncharacterized protein n=1 Tax=Scytonema hofmannii PCC 7110 TaxID=128403 RepID=A0A139XH11_9CYAN|nr:hypothetical protein WA1_02230 [Scytonema hofmannii PCC 7110]